MINTNPTKINLIPLLVILFLIPRGWRNVDSEPRVGGGGVRPKAEKKIVTSQFLMTEEVAEGVSDGSARF